MMRNLTRPGAVDAVLSALRPATLYQGRRTADGVTVLADSRVITPVLSLLVWNHSPDGFNWGYGGSGPAQLALALLIDVGLPHDLAKRLHQDFKWAVVSRFDQEGGWGLPGEDLVAWISAALGVLKTEQAETGVVELDDDD